MNVLLTMYDIHRIKHLDILVRRVIEEQLVALIQNRTACSSDTDLNSVRSSSLLSFLHPSVLRCCNPVQFLAMAIREASVMLVQLPLNLFNPVQFSEMEMIQASVICSHHFRYNDCSPVQ